MRDTRPFKSMDANAAAGHVAYAFTEVASVFWMRLVSCRDFA